MSGLPVRSDDIVFRRIDRDSILIPIRQSNADLRAIWSVNDVGSRIWELADGTRTVEDIAKVVAGEYDVDAETAQADVIDFLEQLQACGCLRAESA